MLQCFKSISKSTGWKTLPKYYLGSLGAATGSCHRAKAKPFGAIVRRDDNSVGHTANDLLLSDCYDNINTANKESLDTWASDSL
ncbi:hypothetical protein TcWFU_003087 [Taenia crassiceps]|uniref:Uncharacterized protein n=1 Tax=Taenia crassiceps TaxID=6207 RepID=A0ABR4Q8X3_9CEST